MKSVQKTRQKALLRWFQAHKRDLPWRKVKDPYKIWISEVMLQQTSVKTVLPYYERFLKVFPDIQTLAKADIKKVYPLWAGLGYYSRAENLLKSARIIKTRAGFPTKHTELLKLPGFGPYTARAVSSLAFEEPVGVLDGNVIRFLSRFHGLSVKWQTGPGRRLLQSAADLWVKNQSSSQINQALMEQGALICAPQQALCSLCAVKNACEAFKKNTVQSLPLKRAKPAKHLWHWRPVIYRSGRRTAFVENTGLPFLKKRLVLPGEAAQVKQPPKNKDFCHSITHYKIYVTVQKSGRPPGGKLFWISEKDIARKNPSSLIQKILNRSFGNKNCKLQA